MGSLNSFSVGWYVFISFTALKSFRGALSTREFCRAIYSHLSSWINASFFPLFKEFTLEVSLLKLCFGLFDFGCATPFLFSCLLMYSFVMGSLLGIRSASLFALDGEVSSIRMGEIRFSFAFVFAFFKKWFMGIFSGARTGSKILGKIRFCAVTKGSFTVGELAIVRIESDLASRITRNDTMD